MTSSSSSPKVLPVVRSGFQPAEGWLNTGEIQDAAKIGDAVADLLDCYGRRTLRL